MKSLGYHGTSTAEGPEAEIEMGPVPGDIPDEPVLDIKVRQFYVLRKDIEKFGFTQSCSGCMAIAKKYKVKPPHSEACRLRIQEKLKETDEGASRVEKRRQI